MASRHLKRSSFSQFAIRTFQLSGGETTSQSRTSLLIGTVPNSATRIKSARQQLLKSRKYKSRLGTRWVTAAAATPEQSETRNTIGVKTRSVKIKSLRSAMWAVCSILDKDFRIQKYIRISLPARIPEPSKKNALKISSLFIKQKISRELTGIKFQRRLRLPPALTALPKDSSLLRCHRPYSRKKR